jgi:short-subunit dehydrogenase
MPLPPPDPSSLALVTGASSGIGEQFARQLHARGYRVALVARRADRLELLAAELGGPEQAIAIGADLAVPEDRDRLAARLDELGVTVEVLVNNAGFGIYTPFGASGLERELEQLAVLTAAVVQLEGLLLPGMIGRRRGAIINLSSTAGFQALPGNGTYAACKAFVLLHSEALHAELKPHGITVTAVCPGPVRTEFQEVSEPLFADRMPGIVWKGPERVARDALRAAERGKRTVIPGGLAVRLFFGPNRFIPTALTAPVTRHLMARELQRGGGSAGEPAQPSTAANP